MSAGSRWLPYTSLLVLLGAGCSHMLESRAIARFADNLREENLAGLKAATSGEFSDKALRTASALQDIRILNLPDGKTSIVEVEEVSPNRRRVTVQVGEAKKEIFYELVKSDGGRWVVDDIYLKQKKNGVTAYKSVTEQMDLLLSVREFLDAWDGGDRDRVLAVADLELRAALEQLPPSYLAQLTARVVGDRDSRAKFKPQAQLDETVAVVRLPRKTGETVLSFTLAHDHWIVKDIAVDGKQEGEKIPSVHKLALAVNTCTQFLGAYQRNDKSGLQPLCDKDFFEGSLAVGNLKQVLLPPPQLPDHELQVQVRPQRADFVLKGEREIVQIEMHREDGPTPDAPPTFRVRDVTIYEIESKQEKRLAALFTAQAMLEIFCQALAERDLDHLRHGSTQDFSGRVWQRLNQATVRGLPLEQFDDPAPEIVNIAFQGALTRIDVRQGGLPATYLMRDESGRFYVDDILWQTEGRPSSVKQTLDLLVPVRNFAAAIALGRDPSAQKTVLEILIETCSADFNRLVWQQTEFVPNSGLSADTFLDAPLRSLTLGDQDVFLKFGDEQYGAEVKLRKEYNRFVVDEVRLVAGLEEQDRMEVKQTLRTILAHGRGVPPDAANGPARLAKAGAPPDGARPAARTTRTAAPSAIQPAVYLEVADDPADEAPREIWPEDDAIDIGPIQGAPRP